MGGDLPKAHWKTGAAAAAVCALGVMGHRALTSGEASTSASGESEAVSEHWKGGRVVVSQPKGYLCKLSMSAKVDLPPDEVFDILTDPTLTHVFKSIKAVPYRRVLEDDGQGRCKVEVEQVGQWKFLMFSGSFSTRLLVHQDRKRGTIDFTLARKGVMKDFKGGWRLQALDAAAMASSKLPVPQVILPELKPWNALAGLLAPRPVATLATLEQSIQPAFLPPKPLENLLKGISARQVRIIMEDLHREVERRKEGRPMPQEAAPALVHHRQHRQVAAAAHMSGSVLTLSVPHRCFRL